MSMRLDWLEWMAPETRLKTRETRAAFTPAEKGVPNRFRQEESNSSPRASRFMRSSRGADVGWTALGGNELARRSGDRPKLWQLWGGTWCHKSTRHCCITGKPSANRGPAVIASPHNNLISFCCDWKAQSCIALSRRGPNRSALVGVC